MVRSDSTVTGKERCPACTAKGGDWDGDNLVRYSDGHGYCFACEYYEHAPGEGDHTRPVTTGKKPTSLIDEGDYVALSKRGLTAETCRKFGYSVGTFSGNPQRRPVPVQIAPYYDQHGNLSAQHLRFANKDFIWRGNSKGVQLFGQQLWAGGGRKVVVTEGEIDAMSLSQLQDNKWPVVSLPSGAGSALQSIRDNLEFLESFDEVLLAFDMDEPGREAVAAVAPLFTPGKCRIMQMPRKDANKCLQDGLGKELLAALWSAKPYRPDGILNGQDLYAKCKAPPVPGKNTPYPDLNGRTLGVRPRELWLFTAGSGIGKSTIVNEIAYHLHQTHTEPLGILALEESPDRNGRRYLGIHTNRPLHLPGHDLTDAEYDAAYQATIGRGDWWIYEHFGSTDVDGLIAKIRYLIVACGVRLLVLDHISIAVSGLDEIGESERKTIDKLMTRLRSLVEETSATVLAVVHLKRPDKGKSYNEGRQVSLTDLRGSGSLEQLSDIVVALERDQQGDSPNVARIRVLKNRPTGNCGPAGCVEYHPDTGRLLPCETSDADAEGYGFTPDTTETPNEKRDF